MSAAVGFLYPAGKENNGKQPPVLRRDRRSSNSSDVRDEIEVFEAKRYYLTGMNDKNSSIHRQLDGSCSCSSNSNLWRKIGSMKEDNYRKRLDYCNCRGTRRASLDMSAFVRSDKSPFAGKELSSRGMAVMERRSETTTMMTTTAQDKKKKYNQPSSPGGRLVSFFNSIISSKRKKIKKLKALRNSVQEAREVEDSPASSWRTRIKTRRSSFGYFTSTTAATTTSTTTTTTRTSMASSAADFPGFRTPPPYNVGSNAKPPNNSTAKKEVPKIVSDLDWLDEKFKRLNGSHLSEDEADSDSSSDLFELNLNLNNNNSRFGYCSTDLPVYETTNLKSIKKR